ncbi:transcription initiation factor TFIID subunit 8 [Drosophila grimshawi]|uniref:Transcription initiation factor TFIID subunit 8 n=1 Tax=Drosophila grimshawi TaxID=7222 RepID=B4JXF0_DROGR|nr:transcription initiation factor TFIID subunit 8 [Drosophila grimshawi]EDV95426.1 GH17580 [Drosophila grimshawi]
MDKVEAISMPNSDAYRRVLNKTISQMLLDKGAVLASNQCLETLTQMMQSLLVEIGNSSHNYCELGGRTMPTVGDVNLALINMGINVGSLEAFSRRANVATIPLPAQQTQQRQLNLLQAGTKASHPHYVPSYFPPMPDPHTYIRTPTYRQPVTEYEAIRKKAASQKRDVEKALTKFLCKTSETNNLFPTEDNMFPLIACQSVFPAYMAALNPTDQVFDFEELEYHYLVANRTEDAPSKEDGEDGDSENEELDGHKSKEEKPELEIKPNSTTNKAILDNPNIDNPYLRAATLPKRSKHSDSNVSSRILSNRNGSACSTAITPTPSTLEITTNSV